MNVFMHFWYSEKNTVFPTQMSHSPLFHPNIFIDCFLLVFCIYATVVKRQQTSSTDRIDAHEKMRQRQCYFGLLACGKYRKRYWDGLGSKNAKAFFHFNFKPIYFCAFLPVWLFHFGSSCHHHFWLVLN